MFDPIQIAENTAKIVTRGDKRKYYRFRPARFYGGIATADCVGCCLRCIFCWSWREVVNSRACGHFYTPKDVAGRITRIARKKHFQKVRLSGNEPTIAREHLLNVLGLIPFDIYFILETNGILIGQDKTYAQDLARFENLYVRVSIKGTTREEFSDLTGADPAGFDLQLKALENLHREGVKVHPAAMVGFSPDENIRALQTQLSDIHPSFKNMEIEELVLYGDVEKRLRHANLPYKTAYLP
ncbi:MAG: radical SAM protein [Deltaproteobacteria bacterium]|nr:MAG: radical SAM protein [Deltaproteobacteria bacterium]